MYKMFTIRNNTVYIDILDEILSSYNNSKNRSIGMTPNEARKKQNYGKVYLKINAVGREIDRKIDSKPIFKVGDTVRISKYKRKTFDKGYTPNWKEEIFVIDGILPSYPITYKIKDLEGEEIKGSFYTEELQKTDQTVFRIEKVIRKKGNKALVKWKGYPEKFNSWVSQKDLKNL